jgi:hypothetical protein
VIMAMAVAAGGGGGWQIHAGRYMLIEVPLVMQQSQMMTPKRHCMHTGSGR